MISFKDTVDALKSNGFKTIKYWPNQNPPKLTAQSKIGLVLSDVELPSGCQIQTERDGIYYKLILNFLGEALDTYPWELTAHTVEEVGEDSYEVKSARIQAFNESGHILIERPMGLLYIGMDGKDHNSSTGEVYYPTVEKATAMIPPRKDRREERLQEIKATLQKLTTLIQEL